jgi:hypothetical protein
MIIKVSGAAVGVTTTQYGSGDLMGNKIALTNANATNPAGLLTFITAQDLTKQDGAFDVVFFDADPSATTFTENSALDIADADLTKVIAVVKIIATDYADFNDNSTATKSSLGGIPFNAAAGGTLYACLVSRDTKTYGANELSLAFGLVD